MQQAPIKYACAASGGGNGLDARFTNAWSRKDCRLTIGERPVIRRPTDVRPNSNGDTMTEVKTSARLRQTVKACSTKALRAMHARAVTEGHHGPEISAITRELSRREGR